MRLSVEQETEHRPGRYLAIQVAHKYYAFSNECVREMMPVQDLFPPLMVPGTMAERGLVGYLHTQKARVPVFDLAVRLGGPIREIHLTVQTRMIVVEAHGTRVGFYADRLTDMIQARAHEIRKGTITGHGRPKAILTIDSLWSQQELAELA
jgi:chemotaxis signal transduction protein